MKENKKKNVLKRNNKFNSSHLLKFLFCVRFVRLQTRKFVIFIKFKTNINIIWFYIYLTKEKTSWNCSELEDTCTAMIELHFRSVTIEHTCTHCHLSFLFLFPQTIQWQIMDIFCAINFFGFIVPTIYYLEFLHCTGAASAYSLFLSRNNQFSTSNKITKIYQNKMPLVAFSVLESAQLGLT